ncbi:hypothetical protein ILYODFUR_010461 [Ilyodon furcidens]|uniref:Uncharacterized protein n=1 Tax=Ilyodon furcidens TaxID=33524 RepID=A0ABV0T6X2_9TELE
MAKEQYVLLQAVVTVICKDPRTTLSSYVCTLLFTDYQSSGELFLINYSLLSHVLFVVIFFYLLLLLLFIFIIILIEVFILSISADDIEVVIVRVIIHFTVIDKHRLHSKVLEIFGVTSSTEPFRLAAAFSGVPLTVTNKYLYILC